MRILIVSVLTATLLAGCAAAGEPTGDPTPATAAPTQASVPADPNEALGVALQNGDAAAVADALAVGADPNADLGMDVTPLFVALRRDDLALVELLVDAGADVNELGLDGYTPLHRAAELNGGQIVTVLLEAGADPNVFTTDGRDYGPLHLAAAKHNLEAIEALVAGGVPINAHNPELDATALHYAAFVGDTDAIQLLLNLGADPQALQLDGYTALEVAQANGQDAAAAMLELVTG